MKNDKFIILTLLFTLFLNSSILEPKERADERSDRDSSLRHSNRKERERREKLDYDGGDFGALAGAEIGSHIGARLGDRWERRMNQYSHDRRNNRRNASNAWKCSLIDEHSGFKNSVYAVYGLTNKRQNKPPQRASG